jgi:hypothetical protein
VTASVGTLSRFQTSTAFSTSITVDTQSIKDKTPKDQLAGEQQKTDGQAQATVQPAEEDMQATKPAQITEEEMQDSEPVQTSE